MARLWFCSIVVVEAGKRWLERVQPSSTPLYICPSCISSHMVILVHHVLMLYSMVIVVAVMIVA